MTTKKTATLNEIPIFPLPNLVFFPKTFLPLHVFEPRPFQDVCPWNGRAQITTDPEYQPREGLVGPDLEMLASLSVAEFREKFRGSPIKRTKYRGFLRNVAVAMGNSGNRRFLPILEELAENEDPLIVTHARWAKSKIMSQSGVLSEET